MSQYFGKQILLNSETLVTKFYQYLEALIQKFNQSL